MIYRLLKLMYFDIVLGWGGKGGRGLIVFLKSVCINY